MSRRGGGTLSALDVMTVKDTEVPSSIPSAPNSVCEAVGLKRNQNQPRMEFLLIKPASIEMWTFAHLVWFIGDEKIIAHMLVMFTEEKLKLQEDLFNTQDFISSLTMDNQGHKTKIESLEKCIEELKNTSEEAAEVLKTSLEQTRNENSHLTKQNKDLIIDLKKTAEAAEILKKKISSMQDDLDEVTALEAKIEASQLEQKTLLERCFSSTSTCDSLQRTVNEIRRRLEESQAALHEMGRENQNLQWCTLGPEQPGGGWIEPQRKPGHVQMSGRRLVRAKTNKIETGPGQLAPSLVGWECEG
uniref:Uncharacterized protein n=1 Tax=Timema monikensis TaxID=170555 RepID=A0A7R9HMC3_9NEOP|nr:unnamed protein product [Timema monikensis]